MTFPLTEECIPTMCSCWSLQTMTAGVQPPTPKRLEFEERVRAAATYARDDIFQSLKPDDDHCAIGRTVAARLARKWQKFDENAWRSVHDNAIRDYFLEADDA